MPTIVRKSKFDSFQTRREILHAVSWQVRSHVWSPPTDQYETEEAYVVRVEIAGSGKKILKSHLRITPCLFRIAS